MSICYRTIAYAARGSGRRLRILANPAPATTFQRYVPITWVTAYTGRNISYVPDRVNMQPVALTAPSSRTLRFTPTLATR